MEAWGGQACRHRLHTAPCEGVGTRQQSWRAWAPLMLHGRLAQGVGRTSCQVHELCRMMPCEPAHALANTHTFTPLQVAT